VKRIVARDGRPGRDAWGADTHAVLGHAARGPGPVTLPRRHATRGHPAAIAKERGRRRESEPRPGYPGRAPGIVSRDGAKPTPDVRKDGARAPREGASRAEAGEEARCGSRAQGADIGRSGRVDRGRFD